MQRDTSESNSLYTGFKELIADCKEYVITHRFLTWVIILEVCLAYGFHATHYSFHIDSLVSEYYSGTALISAGRFCAPLIHHLTGLMNFAPFWQTVVMGAFLIAAGLLWGIVYKKSSEYRLSDYAVFAFWAIMTTFPIMYEQLTYPNILIALAYCIIPVVLYILLPIMQGHAAIRVADCVVAVLLLTVCVDLYESFASVYLVGIVAVLLLRYLFEAKNKNTFLKYAAILLRMVAILAISIIVDYAISKLVCYVACGTFDFWYTSNTKIYWKELGIFDGAIWLIRNVFVYCILRGTQSLSWFLFDLSLTLGMLLIICVSIKRKSIIGLLLYIGLFITSISLMIVVAIPTPDRTAQAIPVYVATVAMIVFHYLCKNKTAARVSFAVLIALCLNQTQVINNYAVKNYQRHDYEARILRQVGEDLRVFPINEKPVVFIGSEENLILPDSLKYHHDDMIPFIADVQELVTKGCGQIIPVSFYEKMSRWYTDNDPIKNFEDLKEVSRDIPITDMSFIKSTSDCNPWFETDIYPAMRTLGYDLMSTDQQTYEAAKGYTTALPCYPNDGYIYETEDLIIVNISLR